MAEITDDNDEKTAQHSPTPADAPAPVAPGPDSAPGVAPDPASPLIPDDAPSSGPVPVVPLEGPTRGLPDAPEPTAPEDDKNDYSGAPTELDLGKQAKRLSPRVLQFIIFLGVVVALVIGSGIATSGQGETTKKAAPEKYESALDGMNTSQRNVKRIVVRKRPSPPAPAQKVPLLSLAPPKERPTQPPAPVAPVSNTDQEWQQAFQRRRQMAMAAITASPNVPIGKLDGNRTLDPGTYDQDAAAKAKQREAQLMALISQSNGDPALQQRYIDELAALHQPEMADAPHGEVGRGAGAMPSTSAPALISANNGNNLGDFERGRTQAISGMVDDPRTPYVLRTGSVIPAILIGGINSDLPGQIIGQVREDVYDTPTGRHLLIPKGSRLVGEYASGIKYGQTRVFAVWQRVIFPDGKALDLGAMAMASGNGYAGANDRVDNHYVRIFGSAILLSGIVAGVEYSQNQATADSDYERQRMGDTMSSALGQVLGQTMAEMIRRNMDIAPTLTIRPGFRVNVMLVKDLEFAGPYRAFDWRERMRKRLEQQERARQAVREHDAAARRSDPVVMIK